MTRPTIPTRPKNPPPDDGGRGRVPFPSATPPPAAMDMLVIPLLREIRTCAAEQLALVGRLPCRFPITWNTTNPPADACDCFCNWGEGQAWVRWVETAPAKSSGGGNSAALKAAGCGADSMFEITLEVGVYRCWPVPGEAQPLEESEEEHAAVGMLIDAAAIRRALMCCPYLEEKQWELIREEPVAHSGGCTGVLAQLKVIAADCECGDFSTIPPAQQAQARNLLGQPAA